MCKRGRAGDKGVRRRKGGEETWQGEERCLR